LFNPNANGRGLYHGTIILNVNNLIYVLLINLFKKRLEDTKANKNTKGAIRIRISKKNRQHNGQKKKGQTTIYKTYIYIYIYITKDRVTRTQLKPGGELRCSGRVSSSFSTSGTRRINLVTSPVISREWVVM
jgi:hypothetical protein